MLNDQPLDNVSRFYGLTVGEIQTFQQRCSVFVCLVTQFAKELQWWNIYNLLNQYMDRINFVVQEELQELIDSMKEAALLDAAKARAIYESGFTSVWHISKSKPIAIMKALQKTLVVKR